MRSVSVGFTGVQVSQEQRLLVSERASGASELSNLSASLALLHLVALRQKSGTESSAQPFYCYNQVNIFYTSLGNQALGAPNWDCSVFTGW